MPVFYRQIRFTEEPDKDLGKVGKHLEKILLEEYPPCGWKPGEIREWHRLEKKTKGLKTFCQWLFKNADKTHKTDEGDTVTELSTLDTVDEFIEKFKEDVGLGP